MIKLKFIPVILSLLMLYSCSDKHFITDKKYRNQVYEDFMSRKEIAKGREKQLFDVFNSPTLLLKEKEALEFLYAYMPYSDLADYDGNFFLNQVKYAFKSKEYFPWGKNIPEDIFRHFVLVYRVNNENPDTARMVFFNELKDRIINLSMYDAALEVNHWCHEKVAYRPSDSRTSAPLATVKNAYGRCGEESTFTVTAMRAVGIPARQCYTPRWAHTDDNHAWVEVFVDGKWQFMGACEPDAELNMGWFAVPATRTMMVHSNVFGKYNGKEEINYCSPLFSRINMLNNYTNTKKIMVTVVDDNNKPIDNATVKFKLYNYAEFYPIATIYSDSSGKASLTTGFGDLLIWACKNNKYGYQKFNVRTTDEIILCLNKAPGESYNEIIDVFPPQAIDVQVLPDEEKIKLNGLRLLYEDSVRTAYLLTFPSENEVNIDNKNLSKNQIFNFVKKSEGNYLEIEQFISITDSIIDGFYLLDYLNSFSDKDFRDISSSTLQSHITLLKPNKYPLDAYIKGILPARISNEMIFPWRQSLYTNLINIFNVDSVNSEMVINWINNNIIIDNEGNYYNCPISPQGVFDLKYADKHSRNIFFVAVCRTLDIPAYIDAATYIIYVYENNAWKNVSFEPEKNNKTNDMGKLVLLNEEKFIPQYWTHFTIAKYDNGDFVTMDYEDDPRVASFPAILDLESGYYLLSTGNRDNHGNVFSKLTFFDVVSNSSTTQTISLRPVIPQIESLEMINVEHAINCSGKLSTIKDLTKEKPIVLCFIEPNKEPTKHLLKDISAYTKELENWNGNIIFATPSNKYSPDFDFNKWQLPKQSVFIIDTESVLLYKILNDINLNIKDNFPLVLIINNEGIVLLRSEGYKIGAGELIYKTL